MTKIFPLSVPDNQEKEFLEIWQKFKEIMLRERTNASEKFREFVKEYVKKHGEGNPSFSLENWVEDPSFVCFPTIGANPINHPWDKMSKNDFHELEIKIIAWHEKIKDEYSKRPF